MWVKTFVVGFCFPCLMMMNFIIGVFHQSRVKTIDTDVTSEFIMIQSVIADIHGPDKMQAEMKYFWRCLSWYFHNINNHKYTHRFVHNDFFNLISKYTCSKTRAKKYWRRHNYYYSSMIAMFLSKWKASMLDHHNQSFRCKNHFWSFRIWCVSSVKKSK